MGKQLILVVDYGTSNVRVSAVNAENGIIAYSASKKYSIHSRGCGYEEISAEDLWSFSESCMGTVLGQIQEGEEPAAVSFSFFGDALIPTDKEGNALNDCILCTDPRGEREAAYINQRIPAIHQIECIGDVYMRYKFGAKVLWVKNNLPEIADQISGFDTQQQYILRKLGLDAVNDYTMAARKQLCDLHSLKWSESFLEVLDIPAESLGKEIVGSDRIIGCIDTYGSVRFKNALPVLAGGHDCDMALIGMGVINEKLDIIGDITGTFDHVGYMADNIVNMQKDFPGYPMCSYHGPLPNTSVCLGAFPTSGATLEWFMREINEGTDKPDYDRYWNAVNFDGTGNIMVIPKLDGGHGSIEGIGVTTTKADIFKAVIEALTFENRRLIEYCKTIKSSPVHHVRIGGGAANSDEWMQLRADISGIPVGRMENIQISSLGSAVLAAVSIGIYPDILTAAEKMVHVKDEFIPRSVVRDKYEEAYQEYIKKQNLKFGEE